MLVTSTLVLGMLGNVSANEYKSAENIAVLEVSFADPAWDGTKVPENQHCKMFGGNGSSPALNIKNIPPGTNAIIVSFNDKTFKMNDNGGHGIIGMWIDDDQASVTVPSVAGETNELPEGLFIEARFRSNRGKDGAYLPPCSGGRENEYDATVKAVYKGNSDDKESRLLGEGVIALGAY